MQILCADSIDATLLQPLVDSGHEVFLEPDLAEETLAGRLAGNPIDVLVVRSTRVNADALAAGVNLGLVVRAGAGTDNVDKLAASALGIYVSNVPGKNAIAVAELTMGLLLAIDRHIAMGASDLSSGVWNKGLYSKADGIFGKQLAILGLGDIGFAVADRAVAFGMSVTALRKPGRSDAAQARIRSAGIRLVDTMDELLGEADVVSLHVPGSDDTNRMCSAEFFVQMKDGAVLLNTSRGDVIDPDALIDAMDNRGIRAGLDVWPDEPANSTGEWTSPLSTHPNVVGSHHIGASTIQAQMAVAKGTIDVIRAYCDGSVVNAVNMETDRLGSIVLTVRHLDKVGVLAKVLQTIRAAKLNVLQMENQLFSGGVAAVATINLVSLPSDEFLEAIASDDDVLAVSYVTGE